jgi:hypothetical protein
VDAPNDLELIEQLLARQPVEVMQRLARHFTPSALISRRLAERNQKIRALAIGWLGTGRELAREIHQDVRRYGAGGFRFERDRPPADPRRAMMHRILVLSDGKAPSEPTIRRALAGLAGSKSGPAMIQQAVHPASRQEPRGRHERAANLEGDHRSAAGR